MEKKTALYKCHEDAGGKIVPFAGYLLPIQYESGIIAEHMAVRKACGLFDVSHMGEFVLKGKDALANLNYLLTNDYTNMDDGRARYGILCYEDGGAVDDLLVHRVSENHYFIVVNASNREKDAGWIKDHIFGEAEFSDISDEISELALQGPKSEAILQKLSVDVPVKYYTFKQNVNVGGINAMVARTGYTGEIGFEFYVKNADAPALWDMLLSAGKEFGLIPCGLGARDTLRLEAAMPLYGHELDETITPLEAGLDFGVKPEKNFVGRDAMVAKGRSRVRVGLKCIGKGIIREHQDVYADGELIGHTTSGTFCPLLGGSYAMALVNSKMSAIGRNVEVDVRGRRILCEMVQLPFYKRA